jgi:hypothetical protein
MLSTSSISEQVWLEVARFIGWWGWLARHKHVAEVSIPTLVESQYLDTINDACHLIDKLNAELQLVTLERDKHEIEVRLLWDELKWMNAVLKAAKVQLSDYDYLRCK